MQLLIIANSARMLAQAALNCQFTALVIDCYGDQDTRQLACAFKQVNSLKIKELAAACLFFKQHYAVQYCIYGSGFESEPESLFFLQTHFQLLGNNAETFALLHNKRHFFQSLCQLQIRHPAVCFTPPKGKGWLIKPQQAQGGQGIFHYHPQHVHTADYYQRYQAGQAMSVLFLANKQHCQIIGFNQQGIRCIHNQPFVFKNIIGSMRLSKTVQQTLKNWLEKLTAFYKLQGLNSLDFILAGTDCYALEINPRPPASCQLYQANLLALHHQACLGNLEKPLSIQSVSAYQIVYAPMTLQLKSDLILPDYCADIPVTGAIIRTGQPICSMIVKGKDVQSVINDLRLKEHFIFSTVRKHNDYGIQSKR